MAEKTRVVIGYWYSKDEPQYPMPKASHYDNSEVLFELDLMERRAREVAYRGWSTCRICGAHNGSTEFQLDTAYHKFVWPVGLRHYLKDHHVKPPAELLNAIHIVSLQ